MRRWLALRLLGNPEISVGYEGPVTADWQYTRRVLTCVTLACAAGAAAGIFSSVILGMATVAIMVFAWPPTITVTHSGTETVSLRDVV